MIDLSHEDTKTESSTKFSLLSQRGKTFEKEIVGIAINIHKQPGAGLLENVYSKCFYYELNKREIFFEREKVVPIVYNSLIADDRLRLDLINDR